MTKTCPQCQAPILKTQRFCRYCGYRLDEGLQDYVETNTFDQTMSPVVHPIGDTSRYPSYWPPVGGETSSLTGGRRRSKILYGVLALILLCALCAGGVFYRASDLNGLPFSSSRSATGARGSYIGVSFADDGADGAFIESIATEGGPADLAGLIGGDVIIEADGKLIRSRDDMTRLLSSTPPGRQLHIKFLRDGQPMKTVLVTAARSDFADRPMRQPHGFFGIDPGDLKRVPVPGKSIWGVRLDTVLTNRPADMAGIREGDIVIEFDGHPIRTPRELIRRINATEPYSMVSVKVMRRGEEIIIPVKMGRN